MRRMWMRTLDTAAFGAVWRASRGPAWLCCSSRFAASATAADAPDSPHMKHLQDTLSHLSDELQHTQEVVRQLVTLVDKEKHREALDKLATNMYGGGGLFIAENSAQLTKGLRTPGARIVLVEKRSYVLDLFAPITIENTHVSIIGNHATVVGMISLTNEATLDASDTFFFAPGTTKMRRLLQGERAAPNAIAETCPMQLEDSIQMRPVLSATSHSAMYLRECSIVNGRDGVYLGLSSSATLSNVAVRNCVRGVYEGVGCTLMANACTFSGNYYQMVLLGLHKMERTAALITDTSPNKSTFESVATPEQVCPPGFLCIEPLELKTARADVVLDQNPIWDTYGNCWKDGKPCELSEEMSTAGLSDPTF